MIQTTLGIDIGGTHTKYGLVDKEGNLLMEGTMPTSEHVDINVFLDVLHNNITTKFKAIDKDFELMSVGVGAPNGNFYNGTIEHAPNLNWKGIVPLAELLKTYFKVPVVLTNDANAAAIGEHVFGGAQGMDDFVIITLGTGLGGGIMSNGNLIYGHDGLAGELGHLNVYPEGRPCNCGKSGCLETYASATGLKKTVLELLEKRDDETPLRGSTFESLSGKVITDLAISGDPIASAAIDYTAKILGLKLADIAAATSPKAFFISGGLAKAGNILMDSARNYFEQYIYPPMEGKIDIKLSQLMDKNAAVLGASALAWDVLDNN